jgi:L-iditol 2-dehydrogenase
MQALILRDVRQLVLETVSDPTVQENSVLLKIAAVGVCGTDLHIYNGHANYHLDLNGRPIPLSQSPQILGHEFAARVQEVGRGVTRCKAGDMVIVDQVLSCASQGRHRPCEYCQTGDSHQCEFAEEYGITGLAGAFAELLVVPEINVLTVPADVPALDAALAEPLGCIIHAHDRAAAARTRYGWEGERRIRYAAILGAGPSGLLFVEYLRNVQKFDGDLFVIDCRDAKLAAARRLGCIAIDSRREDPGEAVRRLTRGVGIQYLIEATGNGKALDWIPILTRKQATLLLYGAGHSNLSPGCLTPWQAKELSVVTSAGASGPLDSECGPGIYRRALELIRKRTIHAARIISHRYNDLASLPGAFSTASLSEDFIKAALVLNS